MRWPWGHRSFSGEESLFEAMAKQDLETCARLLSRNPHLAQKPDEKGLTPVQFALNSNQPELMALLLRSGAKVSAGTGSPLWTALLDNQTRMLEVLLKAGVSPHVPDTQGSFPLYYASRLGLSEAIRLLLKHGAEVDVRDTEGDTPLMAAAASGHREAVSVLLEAGARVQLCNFDGMRALDKALDPEVRRLLVDRADVG